MVAALFFWTGCSSALNLGDGRVDGRLKAFRIFASSCREERLSAAPAADVSGELSDQISGMQTVLLDHIVTDRN